MIDIGETAGRLEEHLRALTETIGERSIRLPENLGRTRHYIESFYRDLGVQVEADPYQYQGIEVANVLAQIDFGNRPSRCYLLGAHYDSVAGTVGADDNASAVAVQLETARQLKLLHGVKELDLTVKFASFALEERPVFLTRYMGSRRYAGKAREEKEILDGMICLEMVGYTCREPGCQKYPFPLTLMDYPKKGNFIGIVGNFNSRELTRSLYAAFVRNPELPVLKLTVPFNGWLMPSVRLSDHSPFWDSGFKAVMVTDSAFYRNPYYHTTSDTMDKLNFEFMAELVESLVFFFSSHGCSSTM